LTFGMLAKRPISIFHAERLEGCNDNEAGPSNTHASTIQHG